MCDINDYSFMRWKSDIAHFLWDSYETYLACGKRQELEKCLNELKGDVGAYLLKDDRQYLIKEFEEKLARLDIMED